VCHLVIDHRFVTAASAHLATFSAWQARSLPFLIACFPSASTDWGLAWLFGAFDTINVLLRAQETACAVNVTTVRVLVYYTGCQETASTGSVNVKPSRWIGLAAWNGSTRKKSTPTSLLMALIMLALPYSSLTDLLEFAKLPSGAGWRIGARRARRRPA
jgi:hypothetical protein